jgi:hypothetical protein
MVDLRDYAKKYPERNLTFGVHLGDTQKVSNSLCAEKSYEQSAYLIAKGPRPTLVVPGNNDWFDCPRRPESFKLFQKYFGPSFMTNWHKEHYEPLGIERSKKHPELFAFYFEGILFVGVHLINARPEEEPIKSWDERMKLNKEWVAENVEKYFKNDEIRGVIIMGHAGRTSRTKPFFSSIANYFVNITSREELPVMYLHGDGLTWNVDQSFSEEIGWKYFADIQIHQSGVADPVIIAVAPQRKGTLQALVEEGDMQTTFGKGIFRIDRRQGVYENPMDIPKK